MALSGQSLFGPVTGVSSGVARAATIIVAKDGSGDTDGIQEGINMLPPGGGVVFIKEGIYTIKSELTFSQDNQTLSGVGPGTILTTTTNIRMWFIDNKDNCIIENMKLVGSGSGNGTNIGIAIQNSTGFIVRNCTITNFGSAGISSGLASMKIENCFITANEATGVTLTGGSSQAINNTITLNKGDGIELIPADGSIISGNIIQSNTKHGIQLVQSDDCLIVNNWVTGNDIDNTQTYDGIHLNNSDRNIISGNRCWDNDNYEIELTNNTCDQNILTGNICIGSDHVGAINDQGTNTHPNGASGTSNLALDDLNIIT